MPNIFGDRYTIASYEAKALSSRIFHTDYKNLAEVIELAKRIGKGQTVYKSPERDNYNITHTERTDLYRPEWVEFQT